MNRSSGSPTAVYEIGTAVPGAPVPTLDLLQALGPRLSEGFRAHVESLGVQRRHSILDAYPAYLAGTAPRWGTDRRVIKPSVPVKQSHSTRSTRRAGA